MDITIPTQWQELHTWQREKICTLLFDKEENFHDNFLKIVRILFLNKNTFFDKIRTARIFKQVPISELLPYADFLLKERNHYTFPKVSNKLDTPLPRLADCSIKQFSVIDAVFYKWKTEDNELYLKQLVATLYRLKGKDFDVNDLPKVAEITDAISEGKRAEIGFVYTCIREYIINKYPKIFPPASRTVETEKPIFKNHQKQSYTPFSKVITAMAMDEKQPLGNLHDCNRTRLYDFFDIFQEMIIRQE